MKAANYKAYLLINLYHELEEFNYDEVLFELLNPDFNPSFNYREENLGTFKIAIYKKVPEHIQSNLRHLLRYHSGYILELSIEFSSSALEKIKDKKGREDIEDLIIHRIQHFPFFLNIAKPGMFDSFGGGLYLDDKYMAALHRCSTDLLAAVETSRTIKWPKLEFLNYNQVWNWYFKFENALEIMSRNSVERALNAFSRLMKRQHISDYSDIFWVLLGLEALYCVGSVDVQKQLIEKSEVLLGPRTAFKKELDSMYKFRSRFVHGDVNIPNTYYLDTISEEYNKYHSAYNRSLNLAAAMLLASLQKLIILDKYTLEFETTTITKIKD